MKILYILAAIFATLILISWIGLNIQPKSFVMPALQRTDPKIVQLPDGLPAPI